VNSAILVGDNPVSDTTNTENDSEMKKEAEKKKLHRVATIKDFLEMWQGSKYLHAAQKESHSQNRQMTAGEYISDTQEIVKASWSLCPHDGGAAFKWSERSHLPPALSANDLPGERTQIFNLR